MVHFSKLTGAALENGETIESAIWGAVAKAAQEILDSFMESEMTAHLGYEGHDYKSGDNFGDSRNEKTVRTMSSANSFWSEEMRYEVRRSSLGRISSALWLE